MLTTNTSKVGDLLTCQTRTDHHISPGVAAGLPSSRMLLPVREPPGGSEKGNTVETGIAEPQQTVF